ncbi:MAG: flagellar filament capping protein FliD [Terriglobales bacterium]|jgi:flagellar hook-associated protein 2
MGISFNAASLLNGDGIDVNAVVAEVQAAQSGQLTTWQGDVTTLQTQATAESGINTDLSNLASAVAGLTGTSGALTAVTATSSLSAVVSATALTGATAANYTVVVSGLASTGTLYTDEVASADTSILTTGKTSADLALQIGGSGGTTADIAITAGSNDTLTKLAASINSQSATNKWGITASVVTDATGARLAIYSQATGSSGALATANNTTGLTFEPPVGGTNAQVTINGIPYASDTNTVTGAIPDVTLNLTSADPATPVTLTVGPNTTSITNSINNFVVEYNTVVGDINAQYAVNPATNNEGPLGSDSALRILQSSLESEIAYTTTDPTSVSSGLSNLGALGITVNNDGTLSVDSSTLTTTLTSNPSAAQNFFTNANSTGFADNLNTALTSLTDPSEGILNSDLAENQGEQTELTSEITNFQTQLAAQKVQLETEFSQVNATLESYPFTLQEVTAELGSMSATGSITGTTTNTNTGPTSGQSVSGSSSSGS